MIKVYVGLENLVMHISHVVIGHYFSLQKVCSSCALCAALVLNHLGFKKPLGTVISVQKIKKRDMNGERIRQKGHKLCLQPVE